MTGTKKKETGPKAAFGSANLPPPKPKYALPADVKPKAKPQPKHPAKLPPAIKKEEIFIKEKHPPVFSVKDLKKQTQKKNDGEIGPDGTANIIIADTSANIDTMDPK